MRPWRTALRSAMAFVAFLMTLVGGVAGAFAVANFGGWWAALIPVWLVAVVFLASRLMEWGTQ